MAIWMIGVHNIEKFNLPVLADIKMIDQAAHTIGQLDHIRNVQNS